MKQRISEKKLRKCRVVTGRGYLSGWARGGWEVGTFECWYTDHDADYVNPSKGTWSPKIRDGQYIPQKQDPSPLQAKLTELAERFPEWL